MAQIIDLFRDATKNKASNEIYGNDASRIESRGLVNVPRKVALAASSPNSVADLIGSQVNGVLLGSANRPSDTIFNDKKPFSKPITILNGIPIGAKEANDRIELGKDYFVKKSPTPQSLLGRIKQGSSSPLGTAGAIATDALRNSTGAISSIKRMAGQMKVSNQDADMYGTKFMQDENGRTLKEDKKFSDYVQTYKKVKNDYSVNASDEYVVDKIDYFYADPKLSGIFGMAAKGFNAITKNKRKNWNLINDDILKYEERNKNEAFKFEEKLKTNHADNKITYVTIQPYGKSTYDSKIVLPGTITGLSDDFTPEWSNFKYIGSPFMQYRYAGVERSIKFDLKLYYTDLESKNSMIRSIEKLKALTFPDEELSVITYGDTKNPQTQALAFSPSLIHMSITGLYTNIFGHVDELSFQIDENVSWATTDEDMAGNKTAPYPTVINVSFGMKVIPTISIESNNKTQTYNIRTNFNEGIEPELTMSDIRGRLNYTTKKYTEKSDDIINRQFSQQ